MALPQIPTIAEIYDRIVTDITGKINQGVPSLPLSLVKVFSKSVAAPVFLLYQAILWVYKQIFPSSAEYDTIKMLGSIVGLYPDNPISAVLLCTVPGTTGAWVYSGETFIGTNNIIYRVTTNTEIIAGEATNVPLLALTSGEEGNLDVGEILDIMQTNLSLTGTAEVTSISTTGSDEQSQESFRAEVEARYRRKITGGSPADYYFWGLEAPNFDWIGVYATVDTPGGVTLYGHVDNQTDGIPTSTQLDDLEYYVKYDPNTGKLHRAPLSDTLTINATDVEEYDLEFTILDGTPALKSDIEDEVTEYLPTLRPYIEGISDIKKNILGSSNLEDIANDIASSTDAYITKCEITEVSTSTTEDYFTLDGGTMVKVRNITWVDI
jgi:uncharacterized phage protein gp47/JayE